MKKMLIHISENGQTSIRVINGRNDDCLEFTRAVETALGVVEQREFLPAFDLDVAPVEELWERQER